jgi:hypothetical protein
VETLSTTETTVSIEKLLGQPIPLLQEVKVAIVAKRIIKGITFLMILAFIGKKFSSFIIRYKNNKILRHQAIKLKTYFFFA